MQLKHILQASDDINTAIIPLRMGVEYIRVSQGYRPETFMDASQRRHVQVIYLKLHSESSFRQHVLIDLCPKALRFATTPKQNDTKETWAKSNNASPASIRDQIGHVIHHGHHDLSLPRLPATFGFNVWKNRMFGNSSVSHCEVPLFGSFHDLFISVPGYCTMLRCILGWPTTARLNDFMT